MDLYTGVAWLEHQKDHAGNRLPIANLAPRANWALPVALSASVGVGGGFLNTVLNPSVKSR